MIKRIASLLLVSVLAACGGSGDGGTSLFGNNANGADGTSGTTPATADMLLTASSSTLGNTTGSTVTITATALDSSRNTISGAPVKLSVDTGAVLGSVSGATTGAAGAVTANLSAGADQSNRLVTVTAVSGTVSKTVAVQVTGTSITATLVPAVVTPGGTGAIQYKVVDKGNNPMVNMTVQVSATGLTPTSVTGTTDAAGAFTYSYTAPSAAGSYDVNVSAGGFSPTVPQTIIVQASGTTTSIPVVDTTIVPGTISASISSNPSVVPVNSAGATGTASQAGIRALFVGPDNKPVKNVRAKFDLNGDANSVGGTFTTGTTTLYSSADGVVTTAYVPGTRSSPTNGVTVRVCYGVSDTDPNFVGCLTSKLVTLTVTADPLSVAIGTNAVIILKPLTFVKQYVVTVVDSAGNPKAGVTLVASVDLPQYRKGRYLAGTLAFGKSGALPSGDAAICGNEDVNRNGVLDSDTSVSPATTEDTNGDGQLWPRKSDVTISLLDTSGTQVTTTTTGADGTATLQLEYAQDHASWVDALITVSASGISGSEGRASYLIAPVPIPVADLTNLTLPPAYLISPYGVATSCTNPN